MRALHSFLFLMLLLPARVRAQTTVILVRHTEKAATPAADPPLAPDGEARARALAQAVSDLRCGL